MYQDILNGTTHRDCPLPRGPWIMMQKWEHLLFLHRRLPEHVLEPHLPPGLELDTYDGDAWISVIPFKVNKVRLRGMPQVPFLNSFLEVNVRTYVKRNGRKGVYFFSLDANLLPAVLGARMASLPYYYADISMKIRDESIHFDSERQGKKSGTLRGAYRPISELFYPESGSLENWLLERYFLWTYKNGTLYRGGIHHKKWEIQKADVNMEQQLLTSFLPDDALGNSSLAHYAVSQIALIWMIRKER